MWSYCTFPYICISLSFTFVLHFSPFLSNSYCVTLCSFCVSVWKLGTPNYRGLSIIMYLAAEMYWHTVPPWKKRTPNVNSGILLFGSISMFPTVTFIPLDLNKYLCLGIKKRKRINLKWYHYFRKMKGKKNCNCAIICTCTVNSTTKMSVCWLLNFLELPFNHIWLVKKNTHTKG